MSASGVGLEPDNLNAETYYTDAESTETGFPSGYSSSEESNIREDESDEEDSFGFQRDHTDISHYEYPPEDTSSDEESEEDSGGPHHDEFIEDGDDENEGNGRASYMETDEENDGNQAVLEEETGDEARYDDEDEEEGSVNNSSYSDEVYDMDENESDNEYDGTQNVRQDEERVTERDEESEYDDDQSSIHPIGNEGTTGQEGIQEFVNEVQGGIEMRLSLFDNTLTCAGIAAGWLEQAYVYRRNVTDSIPVQQRAEELQYYGWVNRNADEPLQFAKGIMGATDMQVITHWDFKGNKVFTNMGRKINRHRKCGFYLSMQAYNCSIAHDITLFHDGKAYHAADSRRGIFTIYNASYLAQFLETCFNCYCGRWDADLEMLHLSKFALSVVQHHYV